MRIVPNTLKSFKKRFKYTICENEPKLENSSVENYSYGFHSSSVSVESFTSGSNHYHVIHEIGKQDHSLFISLYVPAAIPRLVTCIKLLILPTQKNFVQRGSIISRLHVAVEYLSMSNYPSINKTKKELPTPCSECMITTTAIATSTSSRHSTVPDVTMRRFCQLILGENYDSIYQIMDILLSGQGSFVRETSNYLLTFQFYKRNIRSLKNIIHKYLEENWTWTFINELPQFVNTINSRVNRVTKLAPNKTFKKHEPFLISLAISTKKYKPKYEEGDLVRIVKPEEIFRKDYKQNYTDKVFTVFKFATLSPPTYNLIDANNNIIESKFYEPELVQVNVLPVED